MTRDELNAMLASTKVEITKVPEGAAAYPEMTPRDWRKASQSVSRYDPNASENITYVVGHDGEHARNGNGEWIY